MAIFFLMIGLELEREVYLGQLSNLKSASLPVMAALGGMILPAALYFAINFKDGNLNGIGIPMATDIAFALAALSFLGNRVPVSLKIFLTALAVIDDLGAIIVIAIFYTDTINWINLGIVLAIFSSLIFLNRAKVNILWPYLIAGVFMWYFMLHSGVHASITGVLLAFAVPFGKGDADSISYKLQHSLHNIVTFIILPLFALANTAIFFDNNFSGLFTTSISLGIMAGLIIGKPLGIVGFAFASVKMKLSQLPAHVNWKQMTGIGFLGGIGFTMSIFITILAFDDPATIDQTKIVIMIASVIAAVTGYLLLKRVTRSS